MPDGHPSSTNRAAGSSRMPHRRAFLKALTGTAVGAVARGAAHGFLYERHHLEVTRQAFPISGLPEALRGLSIGVLTDIHRSQTVSHALVTSAVGMLMAERPDLILLGGDYVSWRDQRYVHPAAHALAGPSAPPGVIPILGNPAHGRGRAAAPPAKGVFLLKSTR